MEEGICDAVRNKQELEDKRVVLDTSAVQCDREQEIVTLKKQLRKAEFERDLAQRYVDSLKSEVSALNAKLHEERQKNSKKLSDANTLLQGRPDIDKDVCTEEQSKDMEESKSLKETLEEVAKDALSMSGLVYDDRTALYYDWTTGFYYDPNSHLYYDNEKGVYYYYDERIKIYRFHSQVQFSDSGKTSQSSLTQEENEEDSGSGSMVDPNIDERNSQVVDGRVPCVRAIVTSSTTMKRGSLFIITCKGCTVGRDKGMNHLIRIPDVEVSKRKYRKLGCRWRRETNIEYPTRPTRQQGTKITPEHCAIEFDTERRQYFMCDLGSRNGTFLNQNRLSESKDRSAMHVVTHGDSLMVGGTVLRLHIHPATDTCDECEPGQLQAQLLIPDVGDDVGVTVVGPEMPLAEEKRRKEMKRLKKAYCLEGDDFCEDVLDVSHSVKYKDRADIRRAKVGSDTPVVVQDTEPSSVHRPIAVQNKGRQMLEKMGWKEGQGLGRDESGQKEPIIVQLLENSKGLGAGVKRNLDDPAGRSRSHISAKMEQRFK